MPCIEERIKTGQSFRGFMIKERFRMNYPTFTTDV